MDEHDETAGRGDSPDGESKYMKIRDGDKHSDSSSSSSDDEEGKAKGEKVAEEARNGSRRSSTSSDSSAEEDNAEDGMLMAYSHPKVDSEPQESVDYTLKTLNTLDETSSAPADPNQPNIALYIKVRNILRKGSVGLTQDMHENMTQPQ